MAFSLLKPDGERIKETRQRLRLSQQELSDKIDQLGPDRNPSRRSLSVATIQRTESGRTDPTAETLSLIAAALGVAPETFYPEDQLGALQTAKDRAAAGDFSELGLSEWELIGRIVQAWFRDGSKTTSIPGAGEQPLHPGYVHRLASCWPGWSAMADGWPDKDKDPATIEALRAKDALESKAFGVLQFIVFHQMNRALEELKNGPIEESGIMRILTGVPLATKMSGPDSEEST